MNQFLEQFGIDWKLFLSQMVNFALILVILRFFVYKPILKVIKERNEKIQEGLDKAKEAGIRLKEIDQISKEKIKEAEITSMNMIQATQQNAKDLAEKLQEKIEASHLQAEKDLQANYKKQQEEAQNLVLKNVVELVKKTMIKTVELKPDDIDEALIKKAVEHAK